jgi:hypothetical protein
MEYYLKTKKTKNGTFELIDEIAKEERSEWDNYFFRIKDNEEHFFYLTKSEDGIAIYKMDKSGKMLRKKEFLNPVEVLVYN